MKPLRGISPPIWRLAAIGLMLLLVGVVPARAQAPTPGNPVPIYLFWGDGCPHCARAKPYLESLPAKYPGTVLYAYEVYYDQDNQALFARMAQRYGLEQLAVPTIFIGPYYLQGYSEELNGDIEAAVVQCLQEGCIDPGEGVVTSPVEATPTPAASTGEADRTTPDASTIATPAPDTSPSDPGDPGKALNPGHNLELPWIGSVSLEHRSLALSTALIAFVDGVNPCSIWVLTMLLAITLHGGSRKRVLLIGIIFLTVTAGIYALFIAGLFTVLKVVSFLGWIQALVAVVALAFGLVNIKDYFWYQQGISFTIADEKKPGLYQRMRQLLDTSQSIYGVAGATVVLAAGVSLIEFSCTAGFPVLWTNLLVSQGISGLTFVLLLLLYLAIYQLDELVIFFSAVFTLKSSKIEEKHGRILKLIGGMLMLTLAVVMLVNPALMNSLSSSLLIFGAALLATVLVLLVHRILLPKLGIRIGTEPERGKPRRAGSRHTR